MESEESEQTRHRRTNRCVCSSLCVMSVVQLCLFVACMLIALGYVIGLSVAFAYAQKEEVKGAQKEEVKEVSTESPLGLAFVDQISTLEVSAPKKVCRILLNKLSDCRGFIRVQRLADVHSVA